MDYILHIIIMIGIYTILTSATQLLVGMTNLITLGQAAFYGLGAYFTTLCMFQLGLTMIPTLIIILFLNTILGFLMSLPLMRLKGDYFILGTLGFQLIIYSILYNWTPITRGPYGVSGIESPNILGLISLDDKWQFLLLTIAITGIVFYIVYRLIYSPFGMVLKGLRENEHLLMSLGYNPNKFKIYTWVISGALCGWAGYLFATLVHYIDPTSFNLDEAIFILVAVMIGGLGNMKSNFVGAVFVVLLPEILRFIGMPDSIAAPMRQIIYGGLLLGIMYYRPQGLTGNYILK